MKTSSEYYRDWINGRITGSMTRDQYIKAPLKEISNQISEEIVLENIKWAFQSGFEDGVYEATKVKK